MNNDQIQDAALNAVRSAHIRAERFQGQVVHYDSLFAQMLEIETEADYASCFDEDGWLDTGDAEQSEDQAYSRHCELQAWADIADVMISEIQRF